MAVLVIKMHGFCDKHFDVQLVFKKFTKEDFDLPDFQLLIKIT